MPIKGDPATAIISGDVGFQFDTDFDEKGDAKATKDSYIAAFQQNVLNFWDSNDAPLEFNGNRVHVAVTFAPYVDGAAGWKLIVGKGTGDLAKTLFASTDVIATQHISFVKYAQEIGYMFQEQNAAEAPHEFGHMVRLADRYVNGLSSDFKQPLDKRYRRATKQLSKCFSKELNDEANATVGAPYQALQNLMSNPSGQAASVTDRQLSFVFSTSQEPPYSTKGWVFWVKPTDKDDPVWLGNGITRLSTRAGITHMESRADTEAKPCADLLVAIQYQSLRPHLFGLEYQVNADDAKVIRAFFTNRMREEVRLFKWWIRQLSAMNP